MKVLAFGVVCRLFLVLLCVNLSELCVKIGLNAEAAEEDAEFTEIIT